MKRIKEILAIVAALLIITSMASAAMIGQDPISKDPKKDKKAEYAEGEILVKYQGDKHYKLVKLDPGISVEQAMKEYKNKPGIEYVEPNFIVHIMNTPNDPGFSNLWGMNNIGQTGGTSGIDIGALRGWDVITGSSNAVVAVIDTGVDYNHPELAANIWINPGEVANNGIDDDGNGFVDDIHGIDTYNNDADPMDDHNHGTHVSGTIGAVGNNGEGIAGVNWNVRIMPVKFLGAGGSGTTDGAIRAIRYAKLMGAKVMSNSWGGGGYSQALADEINDAIVNYGVTFVAAAGNSGSNNDIYPAYPANYPGVISVAAIDHNGQLAYFSNYGANKVHLGAPGVNVYSTVRNEGYATYSGTSMATPHVAGVAALIKAQYPDATKEEIEARLLGGTVPIASLAGKTLTGGMLNAYNPLETDNIPPVAITDLATSGVTTDSVTLTWTAPGDDGNSGKASSYDIRYHTKPIIEVNWAEAIQVSGESVPKSAGSLETFTVTGLEFNTTYYLAIKAIDNVGNPSEISNVISAATPNPFVVFYDDMENGTNGWTHYGTGDNWALGNPTSGPGYAYSGSNVWATNLAGFYGANNMRASLVSPPFDLTNLDSAWLSIQHYYQTELGFDGVIFEASTDGNNWTQITPVGGYPFTALYQGNPLGQVPAYSGFAVTGWNEAKFDMASYVGYNNVQIRITLGTDYSLNSYYGEYIDDFMVYGMQTDLPPTPTPTPTPVPNYPPVALSQDVIAVEDNSINIVLSGYDGNGDPLTFFMDAYPQYGFISQDQDFAHNGMLTYMPHQNYNGIDGFTFRVNDGAVDSQPGIVEVNITPVNDAPVALPQNVTLDEDTSVNITLTGSDVEGSPLTFSITENPANGAIVIGAGGVISYTPNADYNGNDQIRFVANDGELTSEPDMVAITVNPMPEKCWDASNKYLVNSKDKNQIRKFASCAAGVYAYDSISFEKGKDKYIAYQYNDSGNNNEWTVNAVNSASRPIYAVIVNGRTYKTNEDHFR